MRLLFSQQQEITKDNDPTRLASLPTLIEKKDQMIENLRKEILSVYNTLEQEREEWIQREMNQDRLVQKLIQEREASRKAEICHSDIAKRLGENVSETVSLRERVEALKTENTTLSSELNKTIKDLSEENRMLKANAEHFKSQVIKHHSI
jgi:chromosome segregation ATPase